MLFLYGSFLVDSENPSRGEGGDVELGARTSKEIICVYDYFLSCSTILALLILVFYIHFHLLFISSCQFSLP